MSTDVEASVRALEIAIARLQERFDASEAATKLQATEYARRLKDLNGEYQRDKDRQTDYVTTDKYEDKIAAMDSARVAAVNSEKDAREAALLRVDEKFDDYVKKWEQIQQDQAAQIITLSAAAAEAKRIAEDQGRQTRAEADQAARAQKEAQQDAVRRQTRNITLMGIFLAAVVGLANLLPGLI